MGNVHVENAYTSTLIIYDSNLKKKLLKLYQRGRSIVKSFGTIEK